MLVIDRLNVLDVAKSSFRTFKGEFSVPELVPLAGFLGGKRFFFLWVRETPPRILRYPLGILESLAYNGLPRPCPAFRTLGNDPVAVLAFTDDYVFSANNREPIRADGGDVAKVIWPCVLLFFRYDFVLAAIAAYFEGGGVTAA